MTSSLRTSARGRLSAPVLIAIAVTVLAWASAFVVIRGSGLHFSGGAIALGRLAIAAPLLAILVAVGRTWVRPTGREWLQLVAFGALWFGVYNVVLSVAEQSLDAGTAAMIVGIGPILIALGAVAFLRERLSLWLAIGAGVAFLGVALIGVATGIAGLASVGVLWALAAAITYAAGVLFQKPTLRRLPSAQVTFIGCVVGLLVCLPFTGELVRDVASAPLSSTLGVVYLGIVPTALAFSTWGYALARVPAGQLGIATYLVPPVAIVLGLVMLGEVPAPLAIAGGVVSLVGVALSRRTDRPVRAHGDDTA